ncbi:hypothetical protein [Hahella ganghwensis]|uniref:hypothetical protein n=1 Tax=Hahella ganghwensis TaxID=286420 RepID=UPI0012FC059D|nr:hypothetical protein [Hahella ganghwensis]
MPHNSVTPPPIEVLKMQLSFQLRSYLRQHTDLTARRIVLLLESILTHPDNLDPYQEVCGYHKMLLQWRAMACCASNS